MFDFDRSTGAVSGYRNLRNTFSSLDFVYGFEFSPNDSLLYVSTAYVTGYLHQLDVINDEQTILATLPGHYTMGALQLGPDGRIYLALPEQPFLGVIARPDRSGVACQYEPEGMPLAAGTFSRLG